MRDSCKGEKADSIHIYLFRILSMTSNPEITGDDDVRVDIFVRHQAPRAHKENGSIGTFTLPIPSKIATPSKGVSIIWFWGRLSTEGL
jgi:hypothetical protein